MAFSRSISGFQLAAIRDAKLAKDVTNPIFAASGRLDILQRLLTPLRKVRNNLRIMRSSPVLEALFPKVRQGVLAATLTQPGKWWYLSELAQFLHTTPSSLQRELKALAASGILERRREGTRRTYFKAETRSPLLGREVNVTNYSPDELRAKAEGKDHFVSAVLQRRKQFVRGSQRDLDAIVGKPRRPKA